MSRCDMRVLTNWGEGLSTAYTPQRLTHLNGLHASTTYTPQRLTHHDSLHTSTAYTPHLLTRAPPLTQPPPSYTGSSPYTSPPLTRGDFLNQGFLENDLNAQLILTPNSS